MIVKQLCALLMLVHGEMKEHRIQESMAVCLRGKRTAERQYKSRNKIPVHQSKRRDLKST